MDKIIDEWITKDSKEINLMSPLIWAYVGDAIYELYIRTYLINTTGLKPNKLHIESIKFVKAGSQAEILEKLMQDLKEEEKEIVRRGRNTRKSSFAKKCKCSRI